VRRFASERARTACWSSSGIPSSIPITAIGILPPMSAMKSNEFAPTSGSRQRAQNSRIRGSSAFILRGVKTRLSTLRCIVWIGGSSKMNTPGGGWKFALIISMIAPRAELKVSWSPRPRCTSSNRLAA